MDLKNIELIEYFKNKLSDISSKYYFSLKYKFYNKLIFELPKFENNNIEIFEKYQETINQVLEKVSIKGKTILYFKDNKFINSIDILYWHQDKLEEPKEGFFNICYKDSFGTNSYLKNRILVSGTNEFIFLYNDEIINNHIYADVDFFSPKDSYFLEILLEFSKSYYKNVLLSKGVLQIPQNPNDNTDSNLVIKAFETGFYEYKQKILTNGFGAFNETDNSKNIFVSEDLTSANFINSNDLQNFQNSFNSYENKFFKNKGLFSFEKDGTFNAHSEEISEMKNEKNKLLYKKMKFIEKNINKILQFITSKTGEELKEGQFKFTNLDILKQEEKNIDQPSEKLNEEKNIEEEIKNV